MAEQTVELAPGESKVVSFEATPQEARAYMVSVDGLSGSFKAVEAVPEIVTFSVEVYNIPSYAAGSYQWFILYGGQNWGMIDPQAGVWTPISDPITVTDVPPSGGLRATLHAGPYQSWTFTSVRTFKDGGAYRFNLSAGIIEGPGIALTNLIVEPAVVTVGEPVTISVDVINFEDIQQQYEVTFTIGSTVEKKAVSLGPKETKKASTAVTPTDPGSYSVKADGLYGTFTALAPPEPEPPGGPGTWRNASLEWDGVMRHKAKFGGEIYIPGLGSKKEAYSLLLYQKVTGFVVETWVGPDGRSYPVYEYFLGGEWTTTDCYHYYFDDAPSVPTDVYRAKCGDVKRRIKMIPVTIEALGPAGVFSPGPCAARWALSSSSFGIWTSLPSPGIPEDGWWPPPGYKATDYLRSPYTVSIYSRLNLCRDVGTGIYTGDWRIVERGETKLVIRKTFG